MKNEKQVALLSKKTRIELEEAEEIYCLCSHGDHVWDRRSRDLVKSWCADPI